MKKKIIGILAIIAAAILPIAATLAPAAQVDLSNTLVVQQGRLLVVNQGQQVATSSANILTLNVGNISRLFVQCQPNQTLTAFVITANVMNSTQVATMSSTTADYTTPRGLLIGTSSDLTTLGANAMGWFVMNVQGLDQVKISAATTPTVGVINCYAGGGY